jgi:hypothetical protein
MFSRGMRVVPRPRAAAARARRIRCRRRLFHPGVAGWPIGTETRARATTWGPTWAACAAHKAAREETTSVARPVAANAAKAGTAGRAASPAAATSATRASAACVRRATSTTSTTARAGPVRTPELASDGSGPAQGPAQGPAAGPWVARVARVAHVAALASGAAGRAARASPARALPERRQRCEEGRAPEHPAPGPRAIWPSPRRAASLGTFPVVPTLSCATPRPPA